MIFEALTAVVILGLGALATATIWSRKETRIRVLAVIGLLALIPLTISIGLSALSHPVPHYVGFIPGGDYVVLGMKLVENEGVYLFLDFGEEHPRYIMLAWDPKTAEDLQNLYRRQQGGEIPGIKGVFPSFIWPLDKKLPQFHPLPQPVVPTIKEIQQDEPLRYDPNS